VARLQSEWSESAQALAAIGPSPDKEIFHELKADKAKAIEMFNKGQGGFLDRDLYVFCANNSDGKIVAQGNPNRMDVLGQDQRSLKDSTGKNFGAELFAAGKKPEGQITEVSYMFPKPGADPKPVQKVSFVAKAGDLNCGVGYYK
jgi:hypothetical protein